MKSSQDVEHKLERLGAEWPSEASVVDRVMRQIEAMDVQPAHPTTFRNRWRASLALAAALALVVGGWWLLSPVDNSLYAQALRAIENSHTIHSVIRALPADAKAPEVGEKPTGEAVESWYERGVGFRVNLPNEVRLGNTKNFWTYRKKDKLAIRTDSRNLDDLIDRELDLKRMLDEMKQLGFERFADGDETIDGQRLTAYLLTKTQNFADPAMKAGTLRGVVLLDGSSRIVRSRQEIRQGDRWVTNILIEWQYDVPIDRALFKPDFGDEVRIVDAEAAFDQFVSLDKALYQDERRGILFAIHRLERFGEHGVLVVSSVRGAPQTMEKYPLEPRRIQLGLYFADGPAKNLATSPQGNRYFRIELARVSSIGIDVCWWILVPRGTNAPPYEVEPGKVKLPLGFTPIGWTDYGKTFADEHGILQHVTWDLVTDLPEAKDAPSFDSVSQSVYADMTALSVLPFRQLFMGSKPGTNVLEVGSPDDVSVAQYRVGAARNVSEWYERDVVFQLEGQFTDEIQRSGARWGTPAISVSYNPLVNDFTLAEIGKRTSIERLYLDGTQITDSGLRELAPLKNLHELSLINTPITDAGLKHLANLPGLEKLSVHGTQVTSRGIAELVQAIPGLKVTE
jgi:hypothetical protein